MAEAQVQPAEVGPQPAVGVQVAEERSRASCLEIVLRNERRVLVGADLDEELLVRVVSALERC